MKSTDVIIAVLAGGLVKDERGWRTTGFSERDDFGVLGDRLRVLAGAFLFLDAVKAGLVADVMVCGGKGQMFRTAPDAPSPASVIRKELIELDVPKECIRIEEKSGNTYAQLVELQNMLQDERRKPLSIISNRYHLPRIRAFVEYGPHLSVLRKRLEEGTISFVSAEEVLLARAPETFERSIREAYETSAMSERILLEQKGVEQIKSGTYTYTV